jgi:hypothetical protein
MVQMPVFNGSNFEWYQAQLTIFGHQQGQDAENQRVHDAYVDAAKNYIIQYNSQLAAKQPLPAIPQLPQKKTYNDDGTVTFGAFPDLAQVVPPAVVEPPSGTIASTNPPMDRTDAILMLVQEIWSVVSKK